MWLFSSILVPGELLPTRASKQGNVIDLVSVYIYTKYSTLLCGISAYIAPKVGKYSLLRVQYMPAFHKGFEYLVYYIGHSVPRELLYP